MTSEEKIIKNKVGLVKLAQALGNACVVFGPTNNPSIRNPARLVQSFKLMKRCLQRQGKLVIVCGDNLIAGYRILTWKLLNGMLEDLGFQLQERFGDKINRRHVPPKRQGHKGLIKQEVVSVFARV